MQKEAIKYQPPVEGVVVTQEEEQQILKLGQIAGEQLIKLMTLGLTEKEAEEQIVNGFLK